MVLTKSEVSSFFASFSVMEKEDKKKGNHVALASALSSEESNEDELKEWVKKALEHHPEDEIKKKLKESGWSEKLIDEVLRNK